MPSLEPSRASNSPFGVQKNLIMPAQGGQEVNHVLSMNRETQTTSFQYAKPYEYHFLFHHAVGVHNNLQHEVLSIKGTLHTDHGPVVYFPSSFYHQNQHYLILKHFIFKNDGPKTLQNLISFCSELAWQMIDKNFLESMNSEPIWRRHFMSHLFYKLFVAPLLAKYFNSPKNNISTKHANAVASTAKIAPESITYAS